MLLYAGKASICSFKYSIFDLNIFLDRHIDIVKKLKQWSLSAGNAFILKSGTSETIRNNTENIKNISIHVPNHLKPLNNEQFGHYLAGLIDGKGNFNNQQHLVIVFSSPDAQLAFYIKKVIGFGHVIKVKDKNAYVYYISNKEGILKTINLINNKLRTINKYNQVINHILQSRKRTSTSHENISFEINKSKDFNNHWIAGFSDADSTFQIKIISRDNRPRAELILNFQIDQKNNDLLLYLKEVFGGNIGYRKSQDTYYYGSTSYGSAIKVIHYFDEFHLLSSKYVNYLKWRKTYILIQNKEHLTASGIAKITKLKATMNRGNSENSD